MIIEVFGTGCSNCQQLMRNAQTAVNELGIEAQIIKVEDFELLIRKGITMTPGLVIDGKIRSMGRVPSVEEIKEMLQTVGKDGEKQPVSDIKVINPSCGCSGKGVIFYSCSGGSNVGQISNEATKSLAERGLGKFSCLAGIGSHGEGFISAARNANQVVSLDGCAAKCSFKTLKHAGIEPSLQVVVTDLGIKKEYDRLSPCKEEVDKVVGFVLSQL